MCPVPQDTVRAVDRYRFEQYLNDSEGWKRDFIILSSHSFRAGFNWLYAMVSWCSSSRLFSAWPIGAKNM